MADASCFNHYLDPLDAVNGATRTSTQPMLLDLFDTPPDEEDFPQDAASDYDEPPERLDVDTLKQELLADLNALIDTGLRRVTDTARRVYADGLGQALAQSEQYAAVGDGRATAPWSQAVGDILGRYGLAEGDSGGFYRDLRVELDAILSDGLEHVHRNLESVLQARMSARAELQWQALAAPRDHQHPGEVAGPGANSDNSAADPP